MDSDSIWLGLSPNTPDKAEAWHWENLDGSGTADPNVKTEPAGDGDDASQQPVNAPQGYGKLLDLIGKYESDSSGGYDAVNQIGTSGGHGVKGYAGPPVRWSSTVQEINQSYVAEVIVTSLDGTEECPMKNGSKR